MLGANNQYLSRFQKPYSFDAAGEMTVELIEAPVILNLASKPDVQNQLGRRDATGRNENTHRKSDVTLFPSASEWQWDNGEPVTYENWLPDDFFSESSDAGERDYGITTLADGKWYAVSPDSLLLRMTAMAILEKE